jgi:hypothetical protein
LACDLKALIKWTATINKANLLKKVNFLIKRTELKMIIFLKAREVLTGNGLIENER